TPDVIAGNGMPLLRLTLTAHGQPVALDSVHVEIAGTAPANASSLLQLTDGTNVLAQVAPTSRDVTFSFAPIQLVAGSSTNLTVLGDFASTSGETFGVRLPAVHPFGLGAGVVPFPFDFNTDGIPDAQTNGDYDGDGITDYGFPAGTDYWLNATIPNTFPAPYAGRSVSVYIGPDNRPVVLGDDVIRIFLDID